VTSSSSSFSSSSSNMNVRQDKNELSQFDHEKLEVYQLTLQFLEWVTPVLEEASDRALGKTREVRDQLDRASLSCLLNIAEGNGRRQRPVRAKFFDDARGSATECAACLDALVAKKIANQDRLRDGKVLLFRIVSILCRLVERFDPQSQLSEESAEYRIGVMPTVREIKNVGSRTRTRTTTRTKRRF
jgi:four helix bundle protein